MMTRKKLQRRPLSLLLVASASASSPTPTATPSSSSSSSPSRRPPRRVAVVGGGVIGLSTALRLAQEGKKREEKIEGEGEGDGGEIEMEISVFARGFDSETTSSGAGGLWEPYKLGDTSPELVNRWSAETLAFLLELAREEAGKEGGKNGSESETAGVLEGAIFQFWTAPAPDDPSWAPVAPGFRRLSAGELQAASEVAERGAEENRRRIPRAKVFAVVAWLDDDDARNIFSFFV